MKRLVKYLRLANTNSVGPATIKKIVSFFRSVEKIEPEKLTHLVGSKKAQKVMKSLSSESPYEEKLLKFLSQNPDVGVITLEEESYPRLLFSLPDPPPVLFYVGQKPDSGVGVVGTRKPCGSSLSVVGRIVRREGRRVISGGAQGIDYRAHLEAVDSGLETVVVLGSGIGMMEKRIEKLLERGRVCVLSEFMPWTPPARYTFVVRNRTIAGLSERLYVVEAPKRSGALISAKHALELGREVFVWVGDESSERWEGCRRLLSMGAKPWTPADELGFFSKPRSFDEVVEHIGDERRAFELLGRLMIEKKIRMEGGYYVLENV
ncbi:MAG: DNA-processing protein DprA [Aquificae bacterium]|nr:DNA-processing protein DprA [Aquificota bacterium]